MLNYQVIVDGEIVLETNSKSEACKIANEFLYDDKYAVVIVQYILKTRQC